MNAKSQVCTLEQAKKLKELGVSGHSVFFHIPTDTILKSIITTEPDGIHIGRKHYAAFTVAELGHMLPSLYVSGWFGESPADFNWMVWPNGVSANIEEGETEAQARASMVIRLLERHEITAEQINTRLADS